MDDRYFCKECQVSHDRSNPFLVWFDMSGGCRCAQAWRESHMDDDDQEKLIQFAWLELAWEAMLDESTYQPQYTVVHDCSCTSQESDPRPMALCRDCQRRLNDEERY